MEKQFGNQPSLEEVTNAEEMMTEEQKESSNERIYEEEADKALGEYLAIEERQRSYLNKSRSSLLCAAEKIEGGYFNNNGKEKALFIYEELEHNKKVNEIKSKLIEESTKKGGLIDNMSASDSLRDSLAMIYERFGNTEKAKEVASQEIKKYKAADYDKEVLWAIDEFRLTYFAEMFRILGDNEKEEEVLNKIEGKVFEQYLRRKEDVKEEGGLMFVDGQTGTNSSGYIHSMDELIELNKILFRKFGKKEYKQKLEEIQREEAKELKNNPYMKDDVWHVKRALHIYEEIGDVEMIGHCMEEIVKRGSTLNDPAQWEEAAIVCGQLGEKDKANSLWLQCAEYLESQRGYSGITSLDAIRCYVYADKKDDAVRLITEEEKEETQDYELLAKAYELIGNGEKASEYWIKVTEEYKRIINGYGRPENAMSYLNDVGEIFERIGKNEEAIKMYEKYADLNLKIASLKSGNYEVYDAYLTASRTYQHIAEILE